ncbi:unnamed protein product [Paramecium octaurelia]|uniref:Uncharacterized protein n=1 Tax=Paramecium octaurelia TaxID=43137 RepID=A0A8S1WFZ8_PAROT|nr:unnamed protein product [Paramecium octaurelia]
MKVLMYQEIINKDKIWLMAFSRRNLSHLQKEIQQQICWLAQTDHFQVLEEQELWFDKADIRFYIEIFGNCYKEILKSNPENNMKIMAEKLQQSELKSHFNKEELQNGGGIDCENILKMSMKFKQYRDNIHRYLPMKIGYGGREMNIVKLGFHSEQEGIQFNVVRWYIDSYMTQRLLLTLKIERMYKIRHVDKKNVPSYIG